MGNMPSFRVEGRQHLLQQGHGGASAVEVCSCEATVVRDLRGCQEGVIQGLHRVYTGGYVGEQDLRVPSRGPSF